MERRSFLKSLGAAAVGAAAIASLPPSIVRAQSVHVYLARWVWNATELRWESPLRPQCIGALDFRSLTQCGVADGTGGWGFFAYPTTVTISGATYLGSDLGNINTTRRNAINNNLGVNLTANESLDKVINKLLTLNGDAAGSAKWKPLKIGKDRNIDVRFAGLPIGIGTVQDDQAEFLASMAVRKADYARAKQSGIPVEILRKWNGYELIKYWGTRDSSKLALIVPAEYINDGSDPPETVISDNFNRANEALDAGPWDEVSPTNWTVTSNRVIYGTATSSALARHTTALSSDDHKASVAVTEGLGSGIAGPTARCSTDAAPNHDYYCAGVTGASAVIFRKCVDGTVTDLDSSIGITISFPDTVEAECNNSTMISRFNGVQQHNFTDTSLTGNLHCGLYLRRTSDAVDDFSAEDLSAPPPSTRRIFNIS